MVFDHVQGKLPFAVAALCVLGGLWFVLRDEQPDKAPGTMEQPQVRGTAKSSVRERENAQQQTRTKAQRRTISQERRAEREAMRGRIIAGLTRDNAASPSPDNDDPFDRRARPGEATDKPPASDLKDRSGNHGYLLKIMNEELMPLADECYALALERDPTLAGELMLNIETIGDEQIGGIVEVVEPDPDNQIVDRQLLECMRESIFATTLPAPDESGRDAFMLSMPLQPE